MNERIVILISGTGSNLQAILNACTSGELPATVAAVLSNKADAYGLERARQAEVPAVVLERLKDEDRRTYDARLADAVAVHQPDWIVLAGWMRILTSAFLDRFPNRVINLHPALPGTFPGTHAIERAYEAWTRGEIDHSGVMVHLVPDEGVDVGPVLATEEISFQPGESLEQFESRVHKIEHDLLVKTLKNITRNSMTPNLTFDTSSIIPLLYLEDDQTPPNELIALEKMRDAHLANKIKIWISQKSKNESFQNYQIAGDNERKQKWLDTINFLGEFDVTQKVWVLGVSALGVDTILGDDEQASSFVAIKRILVGNKVTVKDGDIFDFAILFEHYLQRNDLFVVRDVRMFRKSVVEKLFSEFKIRVVSPIEAVEILSKDYSIQI